MKKGWEYKALGEVATIVGGSTPKTNDPTNWGGNNLWVTPAELDGNTYIGNTARTITDKAAQRLQLMPAGTVLLSSRAPIGKVAITTAPMYCNQGFKNIVCSNVLNNKFVYWYIRYAIPQLQELGVGATFKEISKTMVENFMVPVPPLSEQEEIVSRLDKAFEQIETLRRNAEQFLTTAQQLFQSTLSHLLTPQPHWERKKLGDIGMIVGGSTPKTNDPSNWNGNNLWVTPAELDGSMYFGETERHISDKAASKLQLMPKGTVLLSSRAPIGKVAITTKPMYCNQGFKNIVCSESINNIFTYWYILYSVPQLQALGIGATFKEISKTKVEAFPIIVPPLPEQTAIVAKLDSLSAKVKQLKDNHTRTVALCDEMKQALLKEVFE